MSGFLPFLTASTGAAPKMAPEAVSSQTGTDGAFGAVLAGLMGDAATDALPAQDTPMLELAAPVAAQAEAHLPGLDQAGSALARLKLAFAEAGIQPQPGRMGARAVLASSAALFAAAPAVAEAAEANAKPEANIARVARPVAAEAGEEPAGAVAVEAEDAAAPAIPAPALPQQAAAQAATPAPAFGFNADQDAAVDSIEGAEAPAAETDTTPAANTDRTVRLAADLPKADAAPRAEPHELPRHDLSGKGHVRPLAAEAKAQVIQPAPQSAAQPVPANAAPAPASAAEMLAAIAPAAGHPVDQHGGDIPQAETANTIRAAAAPELAAADDLPMIEPAAGKAQPVMQAQPAQLAQPAPAQPAPVEAAPVPASVAEMLAAIAPGAGSPHGLEAPAAAAAQAEIAEAAPVHTRTPAPAAKSAAAEQPVGFVDMTRIEPAAGNAQADIPPEATAAEPRAQDQATRPALTADQPTAQPAPAQPEGVQPAQSQLASVQPLHAQPHAAQAQAQQALPHGAEVVRVATPQQVPEAVGLAISRHVGAESTEFTLRLDPAELGRIEVKLELGKDGQAVVSVQADNASTYDLLRRDSHALERALAEAGLKLDSGGLNFSLRQQDGQNPQQFAGDNAPRQATGRMQETGLAGLDQDTTPRPSRRSGAAGLLDLSI